MASFELSPPSGSRDFLPAEAKARAKIIRTIQDVFERYGFAPLDTPAFERIEILIGKYGDEGDKLIFKILKRGDKAASGEADLALRYDLTVPLARVVAAYRHKLGAIRSSATRSPRCGAPTVPAKGRFREFYQCDVDIVGARRPIADAEVLLAVGDALTPSASTGFTIRLNSRKVLRGLMEAYGIDPTDRERDADRPRQARQDRRSTASPRELEERGVPAGAIAAAGRRHRRRPTPRPGSATGWQRRTTGAEGLAEVDALLDLVAPTWPAARSRSSRSSPAASTTTPARSSRSPRPG